MIDISMAASTIKMCNICLKVITRKKCHIYIYIYLQKQVYKYLLNEINSSGYACNFCVHKLHRTLKLGEDIWDKREVLKYERLELV